MSEDLDISTLLPWTQPRLITTDKGDRYLRKAVPTHAFRQMFEANECKLRAAGLTCGEYEGRWVACWWQLPEAFAKPAPFIRRNGLDLGDSKFILRDYQNEAVEAGVEFFMEAKDENGIEVIPTGGGKSLILANIAQRLDGPCLILQPSKEILEQNCGKFQDYGYHPSVYSASVRRKEIGEITLATIGSIVRKPQDFQQFRYCIVDECFPAGTIVDGRTIETIRQGDAVTVFDHKSNRTLVGIVKAAIKRPAPAELCCINLPGESIISTKNHPFFVDGKGYIEAENIKPGDLLYAKEGAKSDQSPTMHAMRGACRNKEQRASTAVQGARRTCLSQIMPIQSVRSRILAKDATEEPNAEERSAGKNGRNSKENWTQTSDTRRQWDANARTAEKITGGVRRRMETGIHSGNKDETSRLRLSNKLQNRYCTPGVKNSYRGGRADALQCSETDGSKENMLLGRVGVESVEILKRRRDGTFADGLRCNYVYNLEIEGDNNNYFANGVLVHNCHLVGSKDPEAMYAKFFASTKMKIMGCTATPYRLSTDGYGGSMLKFLTRTRPRIFSKLIYYVQNGKLFKDGYLCPLEYREIKVLDQKRMVLNSTGANFTDKSVQMHFEEMKFAGVLEDTVAGLIMEGRKSILVFTRFVKEADALARKFRGAEIVTAETPKRERERVINGFKSGKIPLVSNCGVLGIGFDYPALSTVVLSGPTMSLAQYYQKVGRAIRPHPSKRSALIVDMVGLVERFGKVEDLTIHPGPKPGMWFIGSGNRQLTNQYFGVPHGRPDWMPSAQGPKQIGNALF